MRSMRTSFPSTRERAEYHSLMRWIGLFLVLVAFKATADGSVKDDYGNVVRLPGPAARIVSLAPHLTELVYAAGAGARMVGAVEYSDFPPPARETRQMRSRAAPFTSTVTPKSSSAR